MQGLSLTLGFNRKPVGEILGPVNTVAPAITGNGKIGSEHTVSNGTWTGTGTITYAYQWRRDGVNIAGATGSAYTPVAADDLTDLTCVVAATDDEGSRSRTSAAVAITYAAPAASGTIAAQAFRGDQGQQTISLAGYFTGGGLTYSVAGSPLVSVEAADLIIDTEGAEGNVTDTAVTVTATNSGGSADQVFTLTIDVEPPIISDFDLIANEFTFGLSEASTVYAVLDSNPALTAEQVRDEVLTPTTSAARHSFVADSPTVSGSFPFSGVPAGDYVLHVAAFDTLGNAGLVIDQAYTVTAGEAFGVTYGAETIIVSSHPTVLTPAATYDAEQIERTS